MTRRRLTSIVLAGAVAAALGAALSGTALAQGGAGGGGGGGGGGDGSAGFIAPNPITHVNQNPHQGRGRGGETAATTQGCVTYVHPYRGEICERGRR